MTPEEMTRSVVNSGLHMQVSHEERAAVLAQCNPRSGELGYAHESRGADHHSKDFRIVVSCLTLGYLLWTSHIPCLKHSGKPSEVGLPISIFKITNVGREYLRQWNLFMERERVKRSGELITPNTGKIG